MLIIHDARIPEEATCRLQQYGKTIPFMSQDIVPKPVAGHPDIFLCQVDDQLIIAPDIFETYHHLLKSSNFKLLKGKSSLKNSQNKPVYYNAVITDDLIIHHKNFTDEIILENSGNRKYIHVNQAFTRCSLLPLKDNRFITSDRGIEKQLLIEGFDCLYVNPRKIILPGYAYGLIGGCMGVSNQNLFIIGNVKNIDNPTQFVDFVEKSGYTIVELYGGSLFDGGGLIIHD
ncbi:hypothetical protein LJC68_10580 [Bacteroidales bacterium OttesenSCG-928-B11]|nr:hypothetical protein [Bacteroidales bacterium OttesenSCG-928-B11]MDL2325727.1 hypothetical protein [Bacteroidales bacterium OttesenSCG-928-A14]